jgi:regulator of extracellular matrix RemA (YlzA/DUF370 family)
VENPFLNVGNGNLIPRQRVLRVESCARKSIRRFKKEALRTKVLIDVCAGQQARSYIFLDSRHVIVSPLERDRFKDFLERRGQDSIFHW